MRALMLSTVARCASSVDVPAQHPADRRRHDEQRDHAAQQARATRVSRRRRHDSAPQVDQRLARPREKRVLVFAGSRGRAAGRTRRGSASAPAGTRPWEGSGSGSRGRPAPARRPAAARARWNRPLLKGPTSPSSAARAFGKDDQRVPVADLRRPCARSTRAPPPVARPSLARRARSARRGTPVRRGSGGPAPAPSSRVRRPAAPTAAVRAAGPTRSR